MTNRGRVAAMLVALAVAGLALSPLTRRIDGAEPAKIGGMRAAAADVLWLRAFVAWEQHDRAAVMAQLRLATALNPEPVYFWVNGARMIAHDMSVWRIDTGEATNGAVDERAIEAEQADLALRWLDRADATHPGDVRLLLERASITLIRLHDLRRAAQLYARAAEQRGAPFYAGRVAAELWRRAGEPETAYRWLCRWYLTLPAGDEAAEAPLVLARIRELEQVLHVPASRAFSARAAGGK